MKSKLIVEVAAYGVVGGMTTLLNLILYFLLEPWFGMLRILLHGSSVSFFPLWRAKFVFLRTADGRCKIY